MRKESFNSGWTVWKDNPDNCRAVTLPHDAMLYEKRYAGNASTGACANFDGGCYHYEKRFVPSKQWVDGHTELYFEGSYRNNTVLLNGQKIGGCCYGYSSFCVTLDGALVPEIENRLEVIVDNSQTPNSRWYTGSGIYRPVWLLTGREQHIKWQGVHIHTVSLEPATIHVDVEHTGGEVRISIEDGDQVAAAGTGAHCDIVIPNARLWSDETPNTYRCKVELLCDGAVVDTVWEEFGIRQIRWDAKGLYVNNRQTLLRGGCIHGDNGILGAVSCPEAEWRKIRKLKELGYNALRSSHHPASEEILKACDHYGIYVVDETWDMWFNHKSRFDYASDFETNYRYDLEAMVGKDFNHPSVLMYSIGNEIGEPSTQKGMDIAHSIIDALHQLDPTRPVTGGINLMIISQAAKGKGIYKEDGSGANTGGQINSSMMFNIMTTLVGSGMNKAANNAQADAVTTPILDALDIAGYNYASGRYPKEGKLHPNRLIYGSETFVQDLPKNWAMVKQYPYLIGDFMWTAWDYLGEAGSGTWAYTKDGLGFEKPYPWLLADMGVLDILGDPNGEAFQTAAVWGALKGARIAVRPVNRTGRPAKSSWRGTNAIPSWSWEGCEGKKACVEVYSEGAYAQLYLNGKKIGRKKLRDCKASFTVKYQPGELEVIVYDADKREYGRDKLTSASGDKKLCITSEQSAPKPGEVVYLPIQITGTNGQVESNHDRKITIQAEGGEVLGFGSANPRTEESFVAGEYTSYYGRALAAVRVGESEAVTVKVKAEDMSAEIHLQITK